MNLCGAAAELYMRRQLHIIFTSLLLSYVVLCYLILYYLMLSYLLFPYAAFGCQTVAKRLPNGCQTVDQRITKQFRKCAEILGFF